MGKTTCCRPSNADPKDPKGALQDAVLPSPTLRLTTVPTPFQEGVLPDTQDIAGRCYFVETKTGTRILSVRYPQLSSERRLIGDQ